MDIVHWGIVGAGNVCERKSGPAFYKAAHSRLVAVARRDGAKAKDFAERHGAARWYADAGELVADPRVDAVYVATPPSSHAELTIMALRAGKAVYVEKPMAMTYGEAEEMNRVAEACGQPLFVAHYRRALPYFLKVKELLEERAVGEVLSVQVTLLRPPSAADLSGDPGNWRVAPAIGGEGYFHDLAPHTLDILDMLLGEVEMARGETRNLGGLYQAMDTFAAVLRFRSGVLGSARWCFVVSGVSAEDSIVITGSKGEIRFSTFAFTPIEWVVATGVKRFDIPPPEHIQQPLIQSIVNELRGKGRAPSTGKSAARTARVMDEILGTPGIYH
ncbi:MAG: Gfo/Idh/MocA family oxidoreductase [Odoribacteraceae bacterium]|nr:Gfo/Idh/MocA family oxidoreductase [Odoribacteraceae bacterium]